MTDTKNLGFVLRASVDFLQLEVPYSPALHFPGRKRSWQSCRWWKRICNVNWRPLKRRFLNVWISHKWPSYKRWMRAKCCCTSWTHLRRWGDEGDVRKFSGWLRMIFLLISGRETNMKGRWICWDATSFGQGFEMTGDGRWWPFNAFFLSNPGRGWGERGAEDRFPKGMVFSVVGLVAVLRRLRHAWRRTRLLCPRMSEVWASSLTHCHFLQFPPKLLSFDPSKILHAISWEVVLRWLRFTVPLRAGECGQLAESHHRLVGQIVRWKHFHPNLWKIELLLPGKLSWTLIMMVSNRNLRISRGWKFSGEVSAVGFRGWRSETIKAGSLHFVWLWLFDHW